MHPQSPFACMHNRSRMLIKQHDTGANPFGSCFVNSCFQVAPSSLTERSGRACALQMGYPLQLLAASGTRGLDFPFISQPGAAVAFHGLIQTSRLNTHGQSKSFTGPGPLQRDQCWSQCICYPLWLWGAVEFILLFTSVAIPWISAVLVNRQLYVSATNTI